MSVVIPAFKECESLRRAVQSLFCQDLDKSEYEVIVVDSSPDDGVVQVVQELQPAAPCVLRLFRKAPEGPGPSRRLGGIHARGRILAFMDSDCVATPTWVREGASAFTDGVGLIQGRTLPEPGVPLGIFSWYVRVERENHVYECANIFYRREAYDAVGGFDPEYRSGSALHALGGEDVDLAWRVKRAGWKSRFCEAALVYHEVQRRAVGRWIWIKQLFIWPRLAGKFPELRRHMFARYFFDRHQAWLILALAGVIGAFWGPWSLAACAPYAISRGSEPTRTLRGPLRLVRVAVYLARDLASLLLLSAGSIRHRALLL